MNFKVGDKVKVLVVNNRYFNPLPVGAIGIISDWDKFDKDLPYEITVNDCQHWYAEDELELVEGSEETEMPKQKDLYDFDNMTDDDLDRLISEANVVLINRKKDRLMTCLDDALNALRNFQTLDHNTATTSEGDDVRDVINDLNELKAYYD